MFAEPAPQATIACRLQAFLDHITTLPASLGYPLNTQLDVHLLQDLLSQPLHNVGNPWTDHSRRHPSHVFEREVLQALAVLYEFPNTETVAGYITSGGTEGNLYGLYLAREKYPTGILYFSCESHYSVRKSAHLLRVPFQEIATQAQGELDYQALATALQPEHPAILLLNIGTTMKGAIDNLEMVLSILQAKGIQDFYIHCDAALFGMTLPFIPQATYPTFRYPIQSLSISGHKFLGAPMPCGIVLCRPQMVANIARPINYIDTIDTTLSGCRNGHTPIILWYALQLKGYTGLQAEVAQCLAHAQYLEQQLQAMHYPCFRHPHSIIVVLKKPPQVCIEKWQLAVDGDWAHIVVMQQVQQKILDQFLTDLRDNLATPVISSELV
ncbi:PLP-dependent enzyme, glutamate decarboxylase [Beggiatoa alba B18LD]|uniref:PLP-dependent enzyme, glutamate decarboxylase n=1 Tax=Beggiatoa alba B18LD TaxID=395493 RepID=I3CBV6_9GAMM|nr:histidine decarboxylase [Beggiatoa alba]EIJ41099.1 PLP-dependent enzyme, glutamate decarboxylase [Beggiatoa alba B18LD]